MSNIYDSYICDCGKKIDYVWLFPDSKVEALPNKNFTRAKHNSLKTKYEVIVTCPKCKRKMIFYFFLNGKKLISENNCFVGGEGKC